MHYEYFSFFPFSIRNYNDSSPISLKKTLFFLFNKLITNKIQSFFLISFSFFFFETINNNN